MKMFRRKAMSNFWCVIDGHSQMSRLRSFGVIEAPNWFKAKLLARRLWRGQSVWPSRYSHDDIRQILGLPQDAQVTEDVIADARARLRTGEP
jgi:hypothetical protein